MSQSICPDQDTVLGFRQVVAVDRQLDVFNRPSALEESPSAQKNTVPFGKAACFCEAPGASQNS